jgi:hypothetical protein
MGIPPGSTTSRALAKQFAAHRKVVPMLVHAQRTFEVLDGRFKHLQPLHGKFAPTLAQAQRLERFAECAHPLGDSRKGSR